MKLSIIIPTYNRAKLLAQTLRSLTDAQLPSELELEILAVNNNSTDETEKVIKEFQKNWNKGKLEYLFEPQQGRSFAVNSGIRCAEGDLISMIDDDIQINPDWFLQVEKVFSQRWEELDFIGGKILPIWETEPPDWVKEIKEVGICWRDYGDKEWKYGKDTPILTGGHAVFKSEVFREIGFYSTQLGPKGKNLIGCEDDMMFEKLIENGKKGIYLPGLVVYHHVPAYRLSKSHFRQWNFGAGMSWNLMEIHYKPYAGHKIFRVPRYLYREALISLKNSAKNRVTGKSHEALKAEKGFFIFVGYFYGRNLQNTSVDNFLKKITGIFVKSVDR